MSARRLPFIVFGAAAMATPACAQVPDLLNALDAGGRAMGVGGSLYPTSSDTLSSYYNPAGLGYISQSTVGAAVRNLPRSNTTATGDFNNPSLVSTGTSGIRDITHFGAVFPFAKGGLGLSYTVGGYVDDFRQGNVTIGGNPVQGYAEHLRSKTEYFSLGYGVSSRDQAFAWGIAAQFVQESLEDQLTGTVNGSPLSGTPPATNSGVAGLVGVQITPKGSNMSWGFSYRTETKLSNNGSTSLLVDKIPARLLGGVAIRQDGLRQGKDFLLLGLDVSHYFSANNGGQDFQRNAQTTAGAGFEYNYGFGAGRVPLRVGYAYVPGGGAGYGSRNEVTFGLGYRPNNNDYTIDLNVGSPAHGGFDFGISLSYKLGSIK